jgi:hypothetical protein
MSLRNPVKHIVEAYIELTEKYPGKKITKAFFIEQTGLLDNLIIYHFGTFEELKRQAGQTPTRADKKLINSVAKHSEVRANRSDIILERGNYAEQYIRKDSSRYKTILVASDLHDKEIDPFFLRVMLDTAKRTQPDVIALGGDIFDLPEFGKYNVDPRDWDAVGRIKFAHANILGPLRNNAPDAQIDLIEGNHECVSLETEIKTDTGWVKASDITSEHKIASFNIDSRKISYDKPVALTRSHNREIFKLETLYKRERITENHRIMLDGELKHLSTVTGRITGKNLTQTIKSEPQDVMEMDEDIVQLAVWLMARGTVHHYGPVDYMVSFRDLNSLQKRKIKNIINGIRGVKWEEKREEVFIFGPALNGVLEVITGKTILRDNTRIHTLPEWFDKLPVRFGNVVAKELTVLSRLSFMSHYTSIYKGYNHNTAEQLQWFLSTRGVSCTVRKLPRGEYTFIFNDTEYMEYMRGGKVTIKADGVETVACIQTINGTLITRLDGRINYTGNCRLVKHLADFSPATRAILGDLHEMTLGDLFGLTKFNINYIAKADLKSFTEKDHKRELTHNYKVYYDSFMVHHFPHARNMGIPGVNGHHHSHVVWPMFNIHAGQYEWHQLGAGHKRYATYCEGEKWHNGFALAHIDTLTKTVNIEYIPITTFAVVGGKFYHRETSEIIIPHSGV